MNIFYKAKLVLIYILFCITKNWKIYIRYILKSNAKNKFASDISDDYVIGKCHDIKNCIISCVVWLPLKSNCLQRCLAAYSILSDLNIKTDFCIGIRIEPFAFHCWLEHNGKIVFDSPNVSKQFLYKKLFINDLLNDKNIMNLAKKQQGSI